MTRYVVVFFSLFYGLQGNFFCDKADALQIGVPNTNCILNFTPCSPDSSIYCSVFILNIQFRDNPIIIQNSQGDLQTIPNIPTSATPTPLALELTENEWTTSCYNLYVGINLHNNTALASNDPGAYIFSSLRDATNLSDRPVMAVIFLNESTYDLKGSVDTVQSSLRLDDADYSSANLDQISPLNSELLGMEHPTDISTGFNFPLLDDITNDMEDSDDVAKYVGPPSLDWLNKESVSLFDFTAKHNDGLNRISAVVPAQSARVVFVQPKLLNDQINGQFYAISVVAQSQENEVMLDTGNFLGSTIFMTPFW